MSDRRKKIDEDTPLVQRQDRSETPPRRRGSRHNGSTPPPGVTMQDKVRRPSELKYDGSNALEPGLLMKQASKYQDPNGVELLISRQQHVAHRAKVTDLLLAGKPFKKVGEPLREEDYDDFGQWVTTANTTFDSLDFDDLENEMLHEARAKHGGYIEPPKWKMWLVIVLAGVATGVVAYGIDMGIQGLMWLKFQSAEKYMNTPSMNYNSTSTDGNPLPPEAYDYSIDTWIPLLIYAGFNMAYASVAASLVIFGEPLAKGSGIGEIKCYLNGIRLYRVVRLKTLCCKALGILFSVAAGLPCGKEGPMIHSGAAIAGGVSTGKSSKLHMDTGFFKEFRNDRDKRNFVTAGAACGVGVAFGAPVGGLLFAVEEVGSFWNLELTVMVFLCAAIGPWVLQILQHPTSGSGNVQGLIDFGAITGGYKYYDLPFVALLGAMGGLIGASFIKLNMIQTKWRRVHVKTKFRRFLEVLIVTALCSITLILLVTQGFDCIMDAPENAGLNAFKKRYGCNADSYNDMATYFFRSMEDTIHVLTHSSTHIHYASLFKHLLPYFVLTVLTYGIHVPSGLFLPSLALGCTLGHIYAQIWNVIFGYQLLDPSNYALFGATAVLGGLVRMTISVIVIIMEATANTTFFYPLVVVTVCAKIVGDRFTHGIYDAHIQLAQIPLLETNLDRPEMALMCASDIMKPELVYLKEKVTVSELCSVVKKYPNENSLIVVDAEGALRGILLRRAALILLDKKAWERRLTLDDFAKSAREREFLKLKKYKFFDRISRDDDDKIIDLMPYVDQWPYTFLTTAPCSRIHRTFRELGLRHIVIINQQRRPVGVIGRKQLTYLEMVDPKTLPEEPMPQRLMSGSMSLNDIGSEGSPVTMQSWRALDEWQEAYKKGVN